MKNRYLAVIISSQNNSGILNTTLYWEQSTFTLPAIRHDNKVLGDYCIFNDGTYASCKDESARRRQFEMYELVDVIRMPKNVIYRILTANFDV